MLHRAQCCCPLRLKQVHCGMSRVRVASLSFLGFSKLCEAYVAHVLRCLQLHLVEQHQHQGREQDALGIRLLVRLPQAQP